MPHNPRYCTWRLGFATLISLWVFLTLWETSLQEIKLLLLYVLIYISENARIWPLILLIVIFLQCKNVSLHGHAAGSKRTVGCCSVPARTLESNLNVIPRWNSKYFQYLFVIIFSSFAPGFWCSKRRAALLFFFLTFFPIFNVFLH